MKLKDVLRLMYEIHKDSGTSMPYICGGTPRDKVLGLIKDKISDIDITTGDDTVHYLAKNFGILLGRKYNITSKKMDDGHTSIFAGNLKIDFSSNFESPEIEQILLKKGIKSPTDMQKEMFSRDFTCNTLLMTLDLKKIKDPTKLGMPDIRKKILRTCLSPEITLASNKNRIIRVIYLAAKLGFDVDPEIIEWISKNKEAIRESSDNYLKTNIDKALSKDPERSVHLINKIGLWDYIPITESLAPFYKKHAVTTKSAQLKRNYDYGEGLYMNLDKYKSVSDFRRKRRKKRKKILEKIRDMKSVWKGAPKK